MSAHPSVAERTGHATGKLLLFGEHAAVYGHPALGISLPWRLELKISPVSETGRAESRRGSAAPPPLPEQLAAMFGTPGMHGLVEIRSQIPRGLGFGSSAALCVAAERALAGTVPPLAAAAAWRGAHVRERVFHGTPSGADTGLAAIPGIGYLTWEGGRGLPHYEAVPAARLHLVVAAVPRRGDTRAHVAAVAQRMRAGDTATRDALRRLGQCSTEARALLFEPGPSANDLGAVADRAHRMLTELGLGDPAQERLLDAGRTTGASGGKLSGAGGGGACFLVCRDARTAARVLAAIGEHAVHSAHVVLGAGAARQQAPELPAWAVDRWFHALGRSDRAG
ncbi:MAG: hypothetical protein OXH96_02310 [Spirochaetaceae bacterium]|nr:hypothetical protein [Spirochaetaceae bacterium]